MALFLYRHSVEAEDFNHDLIPISGGEAESLGELVQSYFENPLSTESRMIQVKLFQKGIELRPQGVTLLVEGEEVFLSVFDGVVDSVVVHRGNRRPDSRITRDFDGHWYAPEESPEVPVIKVVEGTLVFGKVETEEDLVEREVLDVLKNKNPEVDLLHRFYEKDKQLACQELVELDLRIREDKQQLIVGPKFIHMFDLEALSSFPLESVMIQSDPLLHLTRGSDNRFYDKRDVSKGPVKSIEGTEAKFWVEKNQEVVIAKPVLSQNIGELLQQISFNEEGEGDVSQEAFGEAAYALSQRGIGFDSNGIVIETACSENLDLDDFTGIDSILVRRKDTHPLQIQRQSDDLWYSLGDDAPVESVYQGRVAYLKLPPAPSGISNDISRPTESLVDQIHELRHEPAEDVGQHLANRGLIFDEDHQFITVQNWSRRMTMETFAKEDFFFVMLRPTDHEIDHNIQAPHRKIVKDADGLFYVEGRKEDGPVEAVEKGRIYFGDAPEVRPSVSAKDYSKTDTETLLVKELREEVADRPLKEELKKRGVPTEPVMEVAQKKRHERKSGLKRWVGKSVSRVMGLWKNAA